MTDLNPSLLHAHDKWRERALAAEAARDELLEAAEMLVSEIREHGMHQTWKHLAAAIAKVEGRK